MRKKLISSKRSMKILSLLIAFALIEGVFATEDKQEPLGAERGKVVNVPANAAHKLGQKINELVGGKEETPDSTTAGKQTSATTQGPVEPLGVEQGKVVDEPANAADKLGKKINKLLGNDD